MCMCGATVEVEVDHDHFGYCGGRGVVVIISCCHGGADCCLTWRWRCYHGAVGGDAE